MTKESHRVELASSLEAHNNNIFCPHHPLLWLMACFVELLGAQMNQPSTMSCRCQRRLRQPVPKMRFRSSSSFVFLLLAVASCSFFSDTRVASGYSASSTNTATRRTSWRQQQQQQQIRDGTTAATAFGSRNALQKKSSERLGSSLTQRRRAGPPLPTLRTAADQRWEEIEGNYVLRPSSQGRPKACLHFLGGALVGAAPHVSYRYILERLSEEGYLVVATPYHLSFDHLATCQSVAERFEAVWNNALVEEYDTLPIIGVGHSCGSLLHLLMSTGLYSSSKSGGSGTVSVPHRAANVLMSFNNKPVKESIPYFDELVSPISHSLTKTFRYYKDKPNNLSLVRMAHEARAASDVGFLLQEMARAEAKAGTDLDFLLYECQRAASLVSTVSATAPPLPLSPFSLPFGGLLGPGRRKQRASNNISKLLPWASPSSPPPSVFSDAAKFGFSSLLRPAKRTLQAVTLLNQVIDVMDQIPNLLTEVSNGAKDFFPAPRSVRDFAKETYRAPQTLILQFEDDGLDESEEIESLLQAHHPTKRVSRRILAGGHGAPLVAPPLHVASSAERALGPEKAKERLLYAHADATVAELTDFLDHEVGLSTRGTAAERNDAPRVVAAVGRSAAAPPRTVLAT